jgi:hypothetical protein
VKLLFFITCPSRKGYDIIRELGRSRQCVPGTQLPRDWLDQEKKLSIATGMDGLQICEVCYCLCEQPPTWMQVAIILEHGGPRLWFLKELCNMILRWSISVLAQVLLT